MGPSGPSTPVMIDVIVAAATPWGHAALAIVRLSGEGCHELVAKIAEPMGRSALRPGSPRRVRFVDGAGPFDDGLVVLARGPKTYTGEDTAELTCHGNPLLVDRLVHAALAVGARVAGPGDFTRRALEHGKLDLLRAEALLQVVDATSAAGVQIGRDGMDGRLGDVLNGLRDVLLSATAELEARLDYPGDELARCSDEALRLDLAEVRDRSAALAETFRAGKHLVHGARVALVGAVNAGKSSLFNALLGSQRALVHERAGTTRDVVESTTRLDGVQVTLLDTAGERHTDDPVEAAGLALAAELIAEADLLVVVLRASSGPPSVVEGQILRRVEDRPHVVAYNGVDRADTGQPPSGALPTAAPLGLGIDALRTAIRVALVGETPGGSRLVVANARQRDRLRSIAASCTEALEAMDLAGVAVAADSLTRALEEMDRLTGRDTRESVLDELFSRFCIGK